MLVIESGKFKGKRIDIVPDKRTRYTTGKVRRALISMFDVSDKEVLELCAGSGITGFEFLSNGAKFVTFVDASEKAIKTIKKNALILGVKESVNIVKIDARIFLKRNTKKFDIVFMDPPYELGIGNELLNLFGNEIWKNSIIVFEHSKYEKVKIPEFLEIIKQKKYGNIILEILRHIS
ncbi:16S rRNA (guanine(966)-N(2))-methyltransferase RsmD [Thermosipho ferrireducens]|uniref:16S rRNA (Guanine(966)-N(2))-methyltransferase RsmD n=1 Tax=Thermosipho ferrireducens TaxID=2571116 RepID=A0ABX7S999_9BACT|nr:16S rRNA (guanine(966)-N(2))-methyltransferase RsmD [Thermosipho ferrireducens]QTA37938.1 16S rRNA (guanine(966)-N(2))-methyltransferase RsmD [Thermosipho ferrireducens]